MATRNLEKDKARFAEWRRQKQGREPINRTNISGENCWKGH